MPFLGAIGGALGSIGGAAAGAVGGAASAIGSTAAGVGGGIFGGGGSALGTIGKVASGVAGFAGQQAQGQAASQAAAANQSALYNYANFLAGEVGAQQAFLDEEFAREDSARIGHVNNITGRVDEARGTAFKYLDQVDLSRLANLDFSRVDAGDSAREATQDNIDLLPQLDILTTGLQGISDDSFLQSKERVTPGFTSRLQENFATSAGQAAELQAGNIPEDVAAEIQERTAERNQRTGLNTSGIGENSVLRQLGLSSLQGMQMGDQMAKQNLAFAAGITPFISPMDVAPYSFNTPGMELQARSQKAQLDLSRENSLAGHNLTRAQLAGNFAFQGVNTLAQLPYFTGADRISQQPVGQALLAAEGAIPASAVGQLNRANTLGSIAQYAGQIGGSFA